MGIKRAYSQKFIRENGEIIGINLGYDLCAEHEWGIEGIERALGASESNFLQRDDVKWRRVTKFNANMFFFDEKLIYSCLIFESDAHIDLKKWEDKLLNCKLEKITTAWNANGFGIVVAKPHSPFLRKLFEAFERKDVVVGIGCPPLKIRGLRLAIASKFSQQK